MAPELLVDEGRLPQAEADVFSFGRLAFFVITGIIPIKAKTRQELVRMVQARRVPKLPWPGNGAELEIVRPCVEACVELKARRRPSMEDVGQYFEEVAAYTSSTYKSDTSRRSHMSCPNAAEAPAPPGTRGPAASGQPGMLPFPVGGEPANADAGPHRPGRSRRRRRPRLLFPTTAPARITPDPTGAATRDSDADTLRARTTPDAAGRGRSAGSDLWPCTAPVLGQAVHTNGEAAIGQQADKLEDVARRTFSFGGDIQGQALAAPTPDSGISHSVIPVVS
mmetsp:Transcript_23087/g.69165  ORF Transcript_23087/g.69165 Transcript_23087/m.69165 type:complete len:280 (+) Transcript_23087:1-840(+)